MRADVGSLLRRSWSVSVVVNVPFGWITDFVVSCVVARVAGAPVWSKEMFAPVSMRAVVAKSFGLVQPVVVCMELIK